MSRNSSGTYSLPSGNPVVTGTTITSTWANATMGDLGSEMTNSLDRNGRGAMLAPLKLVDGSNTAPGLMFNAETGSGIYRAGANDVRFQINAVTLLQLLATGAVLPLGLTLTQSQANLAALLATGNGNGPGAVFTAGSGNARGAVALTPVTSDPSAPSDGDVWILSSGSTRLVRARLNGANYTLGRTLDRTALTFTGSWADDVTTTGWWIWVDANDMIHLEGVARNSSGANQTQLANAGAVPASFRPSHTIGTVVGSETIPAHRLAIGSDGSLSLSPNVSAGDFIYLDGVTWRSGR